MIKNLGLLKYFKATNNQNTLLGIFLAVFFVVIFCCTCVACKQSQTENNKTRIESLKGPTTISIAKIMKEKQDKYDFKTFAQVDAIVSDIAAGNVDIALVPANIASVLYKKTNEGIKVIDINTLGVLYCLSQNTKIISMPDLKGKTIYMTGKGTVPQCMLDILLKANNMSETDLNLEFKSESSEVVALINKNPNAVGIINEPQASIAAQNNPKLHKIIDFTTAWKEVFGDASGEPITGVTIVKTDFLNKHKQLVDNFIKEHTDSAVFVKSNPDEIAKILKDKAVFENLDSLKDAIVNCDVTCIYGDNMKKLLSEYLTKLGQENIELIGGQIPDDNFYYLG